MGDVHPWSVDASLGEETPPPPLSSLYGRSMRPLYKRTNFALQAATDLQARLAREEARPLEEMQWVD